MPLPIQDTASVTFPASVDFARIGRVAASGLALRLGFDVGRVENLRLAVDSAVSALLGSGSIVVDASWTERHLELTLSNSSSEVDAALLTPSLAELVADVSVSPTSVTFVLDDS